MKEVMREIKEGDYIRCVDNEGQPTLQLGARYKVLDRPYYYSSGPYYSSGERFVGIELRSGRRLHVFVNRFALNDNLDFED